ncbi:hypothetical protein Drose_05775 [Dactylosporangium roseum]|uniref:Uncharacterized protein n=1 Tax=Dactylosporangium roseum TaxID=47989 RepID=A0ABY5Z6V4_9ACTN|nr:hypothetical protein [Dactylosporangium roseum]UWZ37779.1 hypothetical protein Drose_05775 [Dactylosporangium roseum]
MTGVRVQWRADYGPVQLRDLLGLAEWQVERLGKAIPAPDVPGGRWSQAVAKRLHRRRKALAARAGSIPDMGVHRAAEILSERLGLPVSADAVRELCRTGVIPAAGTYKTHRLYDGRAIEAFADVAVLNQAEIDGYLMPTVDAMTLLGCRERDWRHLIAKGWLRPRLYVNGQWGSRVALFRAKDLRDLRACPDIDWDAVRAVPAGRRSLLAALPDLDGPVTYYINEPKEH